MNNKNYKLFDNEKINSEVFSEWVGMPEFVQNSKEPFAKIIIRFENENDLMEFSKIIGQKLTKKTKSIWYPFKSHFSNIKKVWVKDE